MKKRLAFFGSDTMLLAIGFWLCTLPLLALLILPTFGFEVAVGAALVLFLVALLICWAICGWRGFYG